MNDRKKIDFDSSTLISAKRLTKNTLWNFLGAILPMVAGLLAIPILINGLGTQRFGVLGITWMVVGYFSLFDLGVGRALTMLVAEKLGAGRHNEIPVLVWTALLFIIILGFTSTILALFFSPYLVRSVLKIPVALQGEALKSFYLLSASIPVILCTTSFRGILQAYQRFDVTNVVRIFIGLFNFLGPLIVLPFSRDLYTVVGVLVIGRVIACFIHLWLCMKYVPSLRTKIRVGRKMLRPLLTFGGWVTVGNIVRPLMTHFDRFVVGALLSMTAVTYYTTPYEVVTRLLIIPEALIGVLFPTFSTVLVQDSDRAARLFGRALSYIFIVVFPMSLVIILFAHELLEVWVGVDFALHSAVVLQWLGIGILLNSLAMVPFILIQGAGRPHITTTLHLIELPFYAIGVWLLTTRLGIQGTAIAWVGRVAIDGAFLFCIVPRMLPATAPNAKRILLFSLVTLFLLTLPSMLLTLTVKLVTSGLGMAAFFVITWYFLLLPEDRLIIKKFLGHRLG
ncbi:MAG: flippase [Deltaproteobacteria bacterium]|nr:flippase [Deltaproteobacteria bacterium]MBW2024940.1 flippase [Deltaproteobacteria bacterium]MBW2124969.1 flippase [Deltaproteobacteria bacterium]